ncbi:zf-HC2 domain-containing protein [bacterium]|nr:zf-HC2 domain-containing protein [bacterium]
MKAELLSAFADGELDGEENLKVLAHIESCWFCGEELKKLTALRGFADTLKIGPLASTPDIAGKILPELKKSRLIFWEPGLFGSMLYHKKGYQLALLACSVGFLVGDKNYDPLLMFAMFVYAWVHLFLYQRDMKAERVVLCMG